MRRNAMRLTSLTADELRSTLCCDPETGIFTWLVKSSRGTIVGRKAGTSAQRGIVQIAIQKKRYLAHRLAWLYMTGGWPKDDIDHIDGDASNNRFNNLRDVTHQINQQNKRKASRNNKTGLLGVHKNYEGNTFSSMIMVDGEKLYLGNFPSAETAHAAYLDAKRKLHEGCTI